MKYINYSELSNQVLVNGKTTTFALIEEKKKNPGQSYGPGIIDRR